MDLRILIKHPFLFWWTAFLFWLQPGYSKGIHDSSKISHVGIHAGLGYLNLHTTELGKSLESNGIHPAAHSYIAAGSSISVDINRGRVVLGYQEVVPTYADNYTGYPAWFQIRQSKIEGEVGYQLFI